MKKLTVLLFLSMFLCSCAARPAVQNQDSQESVLFSVQQPFSTPQNDTASTSQDEMGNQKEADSYYASMPFDPYWLLPDDDPFVLAMKSNPIDAYAA